MTQECWQQPRRSKDRGGRVADRPTRCQYARPGAPAAIAAAMDEDREQSSLGGF